MSIIGRAAGLAKVPVSASARFASAATKTAFGADKDEMYEKAATKSMETLTKQLAKARGPALKFGQVLALFGSMLPPDQAKQLESLTQLYENATPRPWGKVEPVLTSIPADIRNQLTVNPDAIAAASLGQVHKGTLNGEPVAIKIQYPDAMKIARSDMLQLRTFVPLIHRVLPDLNVKALLEEHEERLWEELDYNHEARWQEKFRTEWNKQHPGIITVPKVHYANESILITEWIEGTPYSDLQKATEENAEQRNLAGENLARFTLWSPRVVGAIHADPHPGNYRLMPDGTLGVLDFGSIGKHVGPFTEIFTETFKLAEQNDHEAIRELWLRHGMIPETTTAEELHAVLNIDPTPYIQETFPFTKEWMTKRNTTWTDPDSALNDAKKLTMPPEMLLEHRAIGGMLALLTTIEANIGFRRIINETLTQPKETTRER